MEAWSMNGDILNVALSLVLGGLGGAFLTHYLNVRRERTSTIFAHKRENYEILLGSIKGFWTAKSDKQEIFISEVNRSWLYASDDVVRHSIRFLESCAHYSSKGGLSLFPTKEADKMIGLILVAMRKDLGFKKTDLSASEFHMLKLVFDH
jgi:hypothetical protein